MTRSGYEDGLNGRKFPVHLGTIVVRSILDATT